MSITDFLFSLHKLLAWLFTLLTVLLPQHLLAPLSATGTPATAYAAAPQLCVRTLALPHKLDRVALPPSNADEAGASAPASEDTGAATSAPQAKQ